MTPSPTAPLLTGALEVAASSATLDEALAMLAELAREPGAPVALPFVAARLRAAVEAQKEAVQGEVRERLRVVSEGATYPLHGPPAFRAVAHRALGDTKAAAPTRSDASLAVRCENAEAERDSARRHFEHFKESASVYRNAWEQAKECAEAVEAELREERAKREHADKERDAARTRAATLEAELRTACTAGAEREEEAATLRADLAAATARLGDELGLVATEVLKQTRAALGITEQGPSTIDTARHEHEAAERWRALEKAAALPEEEHLDVLIDIVSDEQSKKETWRQTMSRVVAEDRRVVMMRLLKATSDDDGGTRRPPEDTRPHDWGLIGGRGIGGHETAVRNGMNWLDRRLARLEETFAPQLAAQAAKETP
jgi:hypothetical protein